MATQSPIALNSAATYQQLFNRTNGVLWSGSEKIIPVQLGNGIKLWISGLCWNGPLITLGTVRSGSSTHNIYSSYLFENDVTLDATPTPWVDLTNTRSFALASNTVDSQSQYGRLDPVAAIGIGRALYVSCRYSKTDYTDWTLPIGQMYLLMFDQFPYTQNVIKLPAPNLTIPRGFIPYFGSAFMNPFDGYLYVSGQANQSGLYYHYLARISLQYIFDTSKWEYFCGTKWSHDPTNMTPLLPLDSAPEISLWKENKTYYLLAKKSAINTAINLYSSAYISQGFTLLGQVATAVTPPGGGWSNGAYQVPHTRLASNKRLGFYSNGIANDTYDLANPNYKKPTFFEF